MVIKMNRPEPNASKDFGFNIISQSEDAAGRSSAPSFATLALVHLSCQSGAVMSSGR